ncbi:sigma-70 family RNA polymerase sigma factor [Actinomadura welshii]|uniref:sigma-70 family RNA polymerase sigma factor n=1 Tax=Actinomadura welshii TaxID=3103817 RepID=UPI0003AD6CA8|nr:sigma-70 family RNA polymerase sigma factor [Actinomadura madurae]
MERGEDAPETSGAGVSDAGVSDAALIRRARDGDASAYGALYERHLPAARGLARHLAGRDAADDAVQDAFARILAVLKRGGGPGSDFRPYLLTVVRRTVYDRRRTDRRVHHTGDIEAFDPGTPFEDTAVEELERSLVARAFLSLPDRWQTVLWHTEVEGAKPAEVAPILGVTANSAAALAYRAREGLRQAYLRMHLDGVEADDACRPVQEKLGSYVRGALAARETRRVKRHLDGCKRCKAFHAELACVNSALRDVLGPLVLGSASTAYLASKSGTLLWFRRMPRRAQALGAGIVAVAAALAMVLVANDEPAPAPRKPPAVAIPTVPAAAQPPPRPATGNPDPKSAPEPTATPKPATAPNPRTPQPRPRLTPDSPPQHVQPEPEEPGAPHQPAPEKPAERPGGSPVQIHLRVTPRSVKVHVHLRGDTALHRTRHDRLK